MRTVCRFSALLAAFGAVVVVAGCGDNYGGRVEVKGKVTLVGEPIKDGVIVFKPASASNKDTQSGGKITDGSYVVPRAQGLLPGKYVVQITAADSGTPVNTEEGFSPGPSRNFTAQDKVPEDWNVRSKHEIEVKADPRSQDFDFTIDHYHPKYKAPKK
jgi:hypothetical protein